MTKTLLAAVAANLVLGLAAAPAAARHSGPMHGMDHGMMHGMPMHHMHGATRGGEHHGPVDGPMTGHMRSGDAAFAADMQLVHALLQKNRAIRRKVTNLPDGIRTITESDDPQVAGAIKAHVASMERRLAEGREFNLFSDTIPVLFRNAKSIRTQVETTARGVVVVQTSTDAKVASALQAHATEVDELVRDGMAAMMRNMHARMHGGR